MQFYGNGYYRVRNAKHSRYTLVRSENSGAAHGRCPPIFVCQSRASCATQQAHEACHQYHGHERLLI